MCKLGEFITYPYHKKASQVESFVLDPGTILLFRQQCDRTASFLLYPFPETEFFIPIRIFNIGFHTLLYQSQHHNLGILDTMIFKVKDRFCKDFSGVWKKGC